MGVFMKYPTNTDPAVAKPWFFTNDPWQDGRLICNFGKNPSYENRETTGPGWTININREGGAKINVLSNTIEEHNRARIDSDRNDWKSLGFMQKSNDWKNIEITAYLMGGFGNLTWSTRFGAIFDDEKKIDYIGRAYKATLSRSDDECQFLRTDYDNKAQAEKTEIGEIKSTGSISKDAHLGVKFVVYNVANENVKLELYMHNTNITGPISGTPGQSEDKWKLINSTKDSDQLKISWGGPVVSFGWTDSDWVWFRWASVREIIVPR
jgi:hypothetical protein